MTSEFQKVTDDVFVADTTSVRLGKEQINFLKTQAKISIRKRARICSHGSSEDKVHEMLIAIAAESYIHPHKHNRKVESYHVVEGTADIVLLDDAGKIVNVVELGDITTGRDFYYRLSESIFHTLVIHSDFLVFHEVTNGPFVASETIRAPFAPPESHTKEVHAYLASIRRGAKKTLATIRS
jgi:cupin fold WbuC family metalloprotein